MNIKELKQLIKNSASVLIMENGEPSLVVMDYKTYCAMSDEKETVRSNPEIPTEPAKEEHKQQSLSVQELEMIDRLNKEIMALKEQIEVEERGIVIE